MTGLPQDWLWLALGAVGLFLAQQFWPAARAWIDADFKARREREAAAQKVSNDRFLVAFETSATAQKETAEALSKIATALDMFARNDTAKTFQIEEMRRDLGEFMSEMRRGRPRAAKGEARP